MFTGNVVQTMSVDEVGEVLGCGRSRVFELLKAGVLERAPRFGRRLRVLRASVDRALTSPRESAKTARRRRRVAVPETCTLDDFRHLIR
jgi:excisionase family DNA binding protein